MTPSALKAALFKLWLEICVLLHTPPPGASCQRSGVAPLNNKDFRRAGTNKSK